MKAARKVGDAKKHECTFHHCSQETSSDLLDSETRVLGLIRVIHFQYTVCLVTLSIIIYALWFRIFCCTRRFIQKVRMNHFQKSEEKTSISDRLPRGLTGEKCRCRNASVVTNGNRKKKGKGQPLQKNRFFFFFSSVPLP